MIFGHINDLGAMKPWLPAPIVLALDFLKNADYSASPGGREDKIAPGIAATDARPTTKAPAEAKAEVHRANIDIQFLISGRERIGVAADTGNNPVAEDRLADRDALFYASVENECFLDFVPGSFAVLFPQDVHRPVCMLEHGPEAIHKVVVKIRADLLA